MSNLSESFKNSVDVAINVYGKPYQTAITLLTLMKHSGQWIDKIYFVEEKKQPEPISFQFILDQLGDKAIYYKPKFWFWVDHKYAFLNKLGVYRRAIRYQYPWEKSNKKYLLILHNDVYFKDDLVGKYLEGIGNHTAIGKIGQCWNCPAHMSNLCDANRYTKYKPDYQEVMNLFAQYPESRSFKQRFYIDRKMPWTLLECRMNEYVTLINLEKARPATMPYGKAAPFGWMKKVDIGVEWFNYLNNEGHTFANFDYDPYATHSWVSLTNAGHNAMFDKNLYQYEETVAKKVLEEEFGIVA